jgi:multiple sugar transport system ATP-binding protein
MDEPLGALDADFRESMRAEIKGLHIDQHATTVYVTHDQIEAMAMGDRIVVMSAAVIQQVGSPVNVYYDPANVFVARFIGSPGMNLVSGHYRDGMVKMPGDNVYVVPDFWRNPLDTACQGDGDVLVGFRPEAAELQSDGPLTGAVYTADMEGGHRMLHVSMNEDDIVHIRSDRLASYPIGAPVRFNFNPEMVRFFDPRTEAAIRREA